MDGIGGAAGAYTLNVNGPCSGSLPNLTDNGSTRSPNGTRALSIVAKIINNGVGTVGPGANFYTKFFLNTMPNFSGAYPLVSLNYNNLTIPPSNSSTYSFTTTIPNSIPSGYYYLLEMIDYSDAVNETTNGDNNFYFNGTFYVPPALTGGADDRSLVTEIVVPDVTISDVGQGDMSQVVPIEEMQSIEKSFVEVTNCTAKVFGYEISTSPVTENTTYLLVNYLNQIISQGKANGGAISCSVNTSGIYFLAIDDGRGNRCVQKIFVN